MNFEKGKIMEEGSRDLYWARITFMADDGERSSIVLAAASLEYLQDSVEFAASGAIDHEILDQWLESVADKWDMLGNEIFDKDVHFDVYANTPEGEANGLSFLLTKAG